MTINTGVVKRVLLADDNNELRGSLAATLQSRGLKTIEADCGKDALRLGRSERPHLSLLDINMPDMTGVEVQRQWLAFGIRIPVIFMTAEANRHLRVEAADLGAIEVLTKPFGVRRLFELMAQTLGVSLTDTGGQVQ